MFSQRNWNFPEEQVRKRVEKVSALERIRTNVPKETGDQDPGIQSARGEGG